MTLLDMWNRAGPQIIADGRRRLDRETPGVIAMALDPDSHRDLSRQFERRQVARRYVAVVVGLMEPDEVAMADRLLRQPVLTRSRVPQYATVVLLE